MVRARKLDPAEAAIARTVYGSVLPFDRIYLTDLDLGGAVTLAGMDLNTGKFDYTINWVDGFGGITGFAERCDADPRAVPCLAGQNGAWPTFYMGQSIWLYGPVDLGAAV